MKKVLVIVDMQNDFVDGSLGTEAAKAVVSNVVSAVRSEDWERIYVTLDTHEADYMQTHEGKYLPVPHCIRGSEGWKLNSEVENALNRVQEKTVRVEKPTFGSEKLVGMICKDNPDEIVLCGVCTDICVISNALMLRAALHETDISVIRNACAGVIEASHEAALTVMRSCQIDLI